MSPAMMQIVMIVGLFAIMYFLLIRPQKKQEKRIADMRKNIKVGDDIITIGGICGKVVKVKEDKLTIQVGADKTKFDITKWAVSSVEKAAPDSKKKTTGELEEEKQEKEKKVSPKKIKKLGSSEEKADEEKPEEKTEEKTEEKAEEPVNEAAAEPVSDAAADAEPTPETEAPAEAETAADAADEKPEA